MVSTGQKVFERFDTQNEQKNRLPEWNPTHERDSLGLLGFPPDPVRYVPLSNPTLTGEMYFFPLSESSTWGIIPFCGSFGKDTGVSAFIRGCVQL